MSPSATTTSCDRPTCTAAAGSTCWRRGLGPARWTRPWRRSARPPARSSRRTRPSSTSTCPSRRAAHRPPSRCRPSWPRPSRRRAAGAGAAGRADRLASRRGHGRADVPAARRRRRAAVLDGARPDDRGGRPGPLRGGRQVPRPAPDDRPAPADVAAGQLRDHPPARGRRRPPLRLRRAARTAPTSASSPSPRCATSRRCATRPAGRSPSPRSRATWSPRSTPSARPAPSAPAQRLEWNRIMLYIWPPIDLPLDELTEVARRLVPLTEGLGLEQIVVSGRFAGLGRRTGGDRDAPRLRGRAGPDRPDHPAADGADAAARRLHAQAHPDPPPRARLPLRAGAVALRRAGHVRRARPRRSTGWCRSSGRRARTGPVSSSAS